MMSLFGHHHHSDTKYTHNFSSRAVAFYGEHPYCYTGGYHETNPFSDNPYLVYILESVKVHFPKLQFNSAMVTKYENGTQGIPPHSDNEESISPGSMICTISLGETRTLEFRSTSKTSLVNSKVRLAHGDILFMTRSSQNQFEHCIPKDYTKGMRVSITLRHLTSTNPGVVVTPTVDRFLQELHAPGDQPSPITSVCSTIKGNVCPDHQHPRDYHEVNCSSIGAQTSPVVDSVSTQASIITADKCLITDPENTKQSSSVNDDIDKGNDRSTTVYISSSMFRHLDCRKLSSKSQDAHVFAYPGATVEMMKEKFSNDIRRNALDTSSIKNIMLMCGSNNIDSILASPKNMRNRLLMQEKPKSFAPLLDQTNRDIESFVKFLHSWAPSAIVKVINILPRESRCRNEVISDINRFIIQLKTQYSFVKFISTERERFLFTDRFGCRRSFFFSSQGDDNVHLNNRGLIKFANHLKYHAHH